MTATELDGQLELFAPLAPPFTVFTCVWTSSQRCGWCNSAGYGGGACRNPKDGKESFFYSYCKACYDKHGSPNLSAPDLNIVRTVTPRPGGTE